MQNTKTYTWSGLSITVPEGLEFVLYETFVIGEYDSLKIKPTDVVLDAGAFVGDFTIKAAKIAREVIAVEPIPWTFQLLKQNVEQNGLKNVTMVNKALYKQSGKVTLLDQGGSYATDNSHVTEGVEVEATTVDELLTSLGIKVDVVKMDVEGAEAYALKGDYIKGVREIAVELHGENITEIPPYLESLGFKVSKFTLRQAAANAIVNIALHVPSFVKAELKSGLFATKTAFSLIRSRKAAPFTSITSIVYATR